MTAFWFNLILAVVWLLLSRDPDITDFIIGYLVGFLLVYLFSRLIQAQNYVKRTLAFAKFVCLFLWEFIKSNLSVAYVILFVPKNTLKPDFFSYNIEDLRWPEAILLSYCITLTPGTISVKLEPKSNYLIVHSLDCQNLSKKRKELDAKFKRSILGFTR